MNNSYKNSTAVFARAAYKFTVNGEVTFENGRPIGAMPGKVVRGRR
jgi:hypothetical protein